MYLGLYPVTTTTVTTHIIVTTNLLTLTNVELESYIETELANNPALEMDESRLCPRCGRRVEKPPCPHCMQELLAGAVSRVETGTRPRETQSGDYGSDDYDPMERLVQPVRLADHVLDQLRPQLDRTSFPVAAYLVEALDSRGFLTVTLEQAAHALDLSVDVVERVLAMMQLMDPVGVGSRNPRECLLRQLEALPDTAGVSLLRPVAHRILDEYWEEFLHARWAEIPLPADEVLEAVELIRSNLTPYPALADWEQGAARQQCPADPSHYSRPDMAIYYDGDGRLAVEIFSIRSSWLHLSPSFRQMLQSANGNRQDSWVEMAESARLLIKCLGQRQQTLQRAVEWLITYQDRAIREGDAFMQELTRTQLAHEIGVHEATVSRAIMGKTAAMPDGRIVPLSHFFESGMSIKETIRQMISEEDKPLSDSAIAKRLKILGQPIARRTVAKYRNMLGILPVHLRVRQRTTMQVAV